MTKTKLCLILILILATMLRFWQLEDHFSIASDTSREVLVASEAVRQMRLPVVGPFSSAGPFIFSPNWYYMLMLPTIVAPQSILAPWVFNVGLSLAFVGVMLLVGKEIAGKRFGLFLGLLAAVAPLPVQLSTLLMLHVPVGLFAAISLYFFIRFIKTGRLVDVFLSALGIGFAISMHYQALNLLVYFPFFALLLKPRKLYRYLLLGLVIAGGTLIPLLPLLLWDSGWSFHNTREIIYFFRVSQRNLWVPNRWLTYVFVFWPRQISNLIGGHTLLGGFLGFAAALSFALSLIFSRIPLVIWICSCVFFIQFVMLRYYPGEKFDVYLIYQHPLIILLFGWAIFQISKFNKFLFFVISVIALSIGLISLTPWLLWKNDAGNLYRLRDQLAERFPGEKFTLFGQTLSTSTCAYSFSLVLAKANLATSSGHPIGLCLADIGNCLVDKKRYVSQAKFQNNICVIGDLNGISTKKLTKKQGWYPYYPEAVYNEIQYWWIKEKYESEKK